MRIIMQAGIGFLELLFLVLVGSGGYFPETAHFLDPEDYFRSRQVEVSVIKMMELAATDPASGKTQLAQLLALRYLTDHADQLKKDSNFAQHRQVLDQIAKGQKAHDPQGFSSAHAAHLLHRLEGTKPTAPVKRAVLDGLTWFPDSVNLVACIDFHNLAPTANPQLANLRPLVFKTLPKNDKEKMYAFLEGAGNFRVDRVALALEQGKDKRLRVLVRYSGKMNHAWIAAQAQAALGNKVQVEEQKAPVKATLITYPMDRDGPAFALIGDDEVLFVAGNDNNAAYLKEVLNIREKKMGNVASGPLKAKLEQVSPKAVAMVAGKIPDDIHREMKGGPGPFPVFPQVILAQIFHGPQGFDLDARGELDNAEDTRTFIQAVSKLRQASLDGLKKMRAAPNIPPQLPLAALDKLVESIQIEGQGTQAQLKIFVGNDLMESLPSYFMLELQPEPGVKAPQPPPKEQNK
jgi:hypothetical protein